MDTDGFREFLQTRDLDDEQIDAAVALASRYERWRDSRPDGTERDHVGAFSRWLITEGANTWDAYVALARFGLFSDNHDLYVAAVELLDGAEALDTLYERLETEHGAEVRDAIFAGREPPPLGLPADEKPQRTVAIMTRLLDMLGPEACSRLLSPGLRRLEDEWFLEERNHFQNATSFDEYLADKGDRFIAELERLLEEGQPFFSQKITPEVVEFVRGRRDISHGERAGDVLYETKIPYDTAAYLAAADETDRRYHYCHCPWVRESLRAGDVAVPAAFCQCSAGFHKKLWEVVLEQPLESEVVESVLAGDPHCRIAIRLPAGIGTESERRS
jgi:hypothetical protein